MIAVDTCVVGKGKNGWNECTAVYNGENEKYGMEWIGRGNGGLVDTKVKMTGFCVMRFFVVIELGLLSGIH